MTAGAATATYVYALISARRQPSLGRVPRGLPSAGPVRLLEIVDVRPRQWLVVSTVPLDRYGEAAIRKGLNDLAWVSRAAVGHERVIDAFHGVEAVLPMKLFTIFSTDARAIEDVRDDASRIAGLLRRVSGRREWGVRVALDRSAPGKTAKKTTREAKTAGAGYLTHKKAARDERADQARRAFDAAADVYRMAAPLATLARKRSVSELPGGGGALLLDAVFLVPIRREASFRKTISRQEQAARKSGCRVMLSGPWPPYSFVQD